MKDYCKMSDHEINIAIAEMFGIYWNLSPSKSESGGWEYCKKHEICEANAGKETVSLPDYCNNPSDAWPIIFESNIATRPVYIRDAEGRKIVEWEAKFTEREFPRNTIGWDDKNPLRAAMIVYLMMKDEDK